MPDESKKQLSHLETPKKFHLESPLYIEFDLSVEEIALNVYNCMHYGGTLDAYCIWCDKDSVFNTTEYPNPASYPSYSGGDFKYWQDAISGFRRISHRCTRNPAHEYFYYYLKKENKFTKIGQYPSVADFQIPQAEQYRKILGKKQYTELTKGIGLAAHGVGIGSFVYLRRIFENLIEEDHTKAKNDLEFNEDTYTKARMDEKIQLLKKYLPSFLVENKNIYGILSKGIHELSDDDCLNYFNSIKIGIEQILDEKIEHINKQQKADIARKAIAGIASIVA